ncbi:hypothetical protein [Haloarchaeobius litoreus]|uniref:Uncharacterized protein n=1 Tax=Haloarchaeobius litoreus TaxID=755306 RepID=A0ABD6DQE7_9EURY|nr:hypothetical protein [Haloarchaeobius litoreus]
MNRRRILATTTSTLAVASLAGCLGSLTGQDDTDESTPTDTMHTPTDTTHAPTDDDIAETTAGESEPLPEEQQFDADHPIRVQNYDSTAYTLTLRFRKDDDVVHSMTVDVAADSDEVVYNLEQLQPDGIVQYRVVAEVGSNQDSRAVQTNACFGDVNVNISDGEPTVGFEIC